MISGIFYLIVFLFSFTFSFYWLRNVYNYFMWVHYTICCIVECISPSFLFLWVFFYFFFWASVSVTNDFVNFINFIVWWSWSCLGGTCFLKTLHWLNGSFIVCTAISDVVTCFHTTQGKLTAFLILSFMQANHYQVI